MVWRVVIVFSILTVHTILGQINFGDSSRPSQTNNVRPRPPQTSNNNAVSIEFGGGATEQTAPVGVSGVKSLADILGRDNVNVNTRGRPSVGVRRRGSQCSTPLGEAGTCQYIFSR